MKTNADLNGYSRARLDDRQITELIGLARGITADGALNDGEIEYLHKWLAASEGATANPIVCALGRRIEEALADGVVDDDERADLLSTLHQFAGGDFEVGEALKPTTLPLCNPAPDVAFDGRFTFTGTFVFGSRRDCESAVIERGATAGSLTKATKFLVIGEYATDSWAQSSWGRKIEKAAELRSSGVPISIICEQHWRTHLEG